MNNDEGKAPTSQAPSQVIQAPPSTGLSTHASEHLLPNGPQKTPTPQLHTPADGIEQSQAAAISPAKDSETHQVASNGLNAQPEQAAQDGPDYSTPQPSATISAPRPRSIKTREQKDALEAAFQCESSSAFVSYRLHDAK